eukprot:SAG25_NODE_12841_length_274_cov_1.177143_2_plen_70_part_01
MKTETALTALSIMPFPSRRYSTQRSTTERLVPSKNSAADLCRLQSPAEGTPCGSRNTLRVPVNARLEKLT